MTFLQWKMLSLQAAVSETLWDLKRKCLLSTSRSALRHLWVFYAMQCSTCLPAVQPRKMEMLCAL